MGFLICSYFVAHISETCLLFTLFLMIRLSARDKHLPRSFEQQCQDKSASRTPFKSTIRTISEASGCLLLAEMKTFYKIGNPMFVADMGFFKVV